MPTNVAEYYRRWLRNFPQDPVDRMAVASAAVDAFEACERNPHASVLDLEPLKRAASSSHKFVFETGGNLLARLAVTHAAARECLLEMARDKSATARFHAVAYLKADIPEAVRQEIVELALHDRSEKVRRKGIEHAEDFNFMQFLSRLEEMQRTESNDKVRSSLALHLPLLRDGYKLEQSKDGAGYYLTLRTPGSLSTEFILSEEYSEEFVRQKVARSKLVSRENDRPIATKLPHDEH